ncbi:MAG TPA: MFS transporter [Acetobacteraceae bacterium]|jgi:putative MFS transporter|nr:MFS transporter [Acetobacteraceae bacterium]
MSGQTSEALLSLFDSARLRPRYWLNFGLLSLITVLEFFDFAIVAFLLAVLGPQWHLTYGQSAIILYSGGVGAICGAVIWGSMADAWGRKLQLVLGTFICGIGAGAIGLVPQGDWIVLAALRFVVGFGLTAAVTPCLTLVVEITPTRYRTSVTSFYVVFATAGALLASATSAALLALLGWRGVAMLGAVTIPVGIVIAFVVPESARWLMAKGRFAEARAQVARQLDLPLERVPLPTIVPAAQPSGRFAELYQNPTRFWETVIIWGGASTAAYGVYLWGPTIVSLLLRITVQQAAGYFVFVAGAGVLGKIVVSIVSPMMGRRRCGQLWGFLAAISLVAAAYFNDTVIDGVPLLVVFLCCSTFGIDGSFSNLAPYTVEVFGVRLGARSSGLGQAANGVGKILGPLSLALIAGTGNIVSPHATADAVMPAFMFLGFAMVLVGLSFTILGVETHGAPMRLHEQMEGEPVESPAIVR